MLISPLTMAIAAACIAGIWMVVNRVGRERIGLTAAMIWLAIWLMIGLGTVFPVILDTLLPLVQLKERVIFALVIALMALFALAFGLTTRLERLRRDQSRLVRELAITNYRLTQMGGRRSPQ